MTTDSYNIPQPACSPTTGATTSEKATPRQAIDALDTMSSMGSKDSMHGMDSIDNFLADIERRAFHMAQMATSSRDDALDIVQDAMYKLVEQYSQKPAAQWRPLFYRILNSKITDYYRRNAVKNRIISLASWGMKTDDNGADLVDRAEGRHSETPDQYYVRELQIRELSAALKKLPRRQREAFMLRCWEGMSTAVTAETMGCSEGSVKTHYSRAMHSLRNSLEDYCYDKA